MRHDAGMTDPIAPDPITTAVLQNRLSAIAEEMGEAMLRTSYSQILNASRDFSIGLVDARARLVAQADHIPIHVGALPWAVRAVMDAFPNPQPGDVYLLNDPYHGGSHLPDLTAFVPVIGTGGLLMYTVVRAHQSDIGGATMGGYNPGATEIWQEGLRVPPILLTDAGVVREDLVRMLAANVRHPQDFRGDLAAMIGAARLGERRLAATLAEFGETTLLASIEAMLDGAERHARAIIAGWTDGTWEGTSLLDDDGHGATDVRVHAKVTVSGSDVTVDLTGSDPQVRGFINSSHANMQSAVAMALAFLYDPDCARNEGAFRPLTVIATEGTVVWAREGAPVTMCTSHCSDEIVEAIITALSAACPDRVMGGWGRRFRVAIEGRDKRHGRRFIWHLFHARPGGGASIAGNGWNTAGEWHTVGGIKFGSVEVAEERFPLVFEHHEFREGSGGAGLHRGGDGGELWLRVETDGAAQANTAGDGIRHGARGMLGGSDGAVHRYVLHAPDGAERPLATKEVGIAVPSGSRLHVLAGGGGGWGTPA
jgi:N-methylhydantoinase B